MIDCDFAHAARRHPARTRLLRSSGQQLTEPL